jgi:hypothetical protein
VLYAETEQTLHLAYVVFHYILNEQKNLNQIKVKTMSITKILIKNVELIDLSHSNQKSYSKYAASNEDENLEGAGGSNFRPLYGIKN